LKVFLFTCRETKEDLKKKRKFGALRYIEDNENKTSLGKRYAEVPSVQGNKPAWWAIREFEPAYIFFAKGYDAKLTGYYSPIPLICDCRVYYVRPKVTLNAGLFAALLNSGLAFLFKELIGRVMLGEGVLDVMVEDFANYFTIPDIKTFDKTREKNIIEVFEKLAKRNVKPVPAEFKQPDRRALDTAVLAALGLDPDKYLEPLYAAVTELVQERLGLAKKRVVQRRAREQRDLSRVKEQVAAKVLPQGFAPFPGSYLSFGPSREWRNQGLGNGPFKLGGFFMGEREVLNCRGELMVRARSDEEARYIIYSYQPEVYAVKIPHDPTKIHNAVVQHEQYLRETYDALIAEFAARLRDVAAAERLAREVFDEHGVPLLFLRQGA